MFILGISCFYHDAAAALIEDGVLVAASEEERFSRKKHDSSFPTLAIEFCLRQRGIRMEDIDYVVFYEKPLVKFERLMLTILSTVPRSYKVFREAMAALMEEKLWVKGLLKEKLDLPEGKVLFVEHHMSHAASAFLCSPFDEAAVMTVDGVGEWVTGTMGHAKTTRSNSPLLPGGRRAGGEDGEKTTIRLTKEMRFPHSLGLLYSAFTAFLGFEVNEGEYKVMGMAPYGEPKYVDKVMQLVDLKDDGSFALDMSKFCYHYSTDQTFNGYFEEMFGAPREPKARFVTKATSLFDDPVPPTADELERNQYYADVGASIQKVTEEILLKMANHLHRETGSTRLVMAGGVALNSVANYRIWKETPFKEIFIQPAAGDSGGAVGAALYVYNVVLGKPRNYVMQHAYLGEEFGDAAAAQFVREKGLKHEVIEDDEKLMDRVVDCLLKGQVVGWYQGRFEWGPRALGNRSILADPRRADMKDIVNIKIKFREPFRPFAPSVLVDRAEEFFDFPGARENSPGRFMLMVSPIFPDKHSVIPAVTHADGTGRLQTVFKETNPRYYRLIEKFGEATGVPIVLNTSFNLKGEPIVTTPANAYHTFSSSGMDALVLNHHLITK